MIVSRSKTRSPSVALYSFSVWLSLNLEGKEWHTTIQKISIYYKNHHRTIPKSHITDTYLFSFALYLYSNISASTPNTPTKNHTTVETMRCNSLELEVWSEVTDLKFLFSIVWINRVTNIRNLELGSAFTIFWCVGLNLQVNAIFTSYLLEFSFWILSKYTDVR